MRYLKPHPEDARWLRTQLRNHLICTLAIVGCLVVLGLQTHRANIVVALASESRPADVMLAAQEGVAVMEEDQLPPETELISLSNSHGNAVAPQGWRRTDLGWEHVSTWRPVARPLGEIVLAQEAREPAWVKGTLAEVRQMPPLAFAFLQIAAIAGIFAVSRHERRVRVKAATAGPSAPHHQSASR